MYTIADNSEMPCKKSEVNELPSYGISAPPLPIDKAMYAGNGFLRFLSYTETKE